MSLKDIGKLGEDVSLIKDFTNRNDLLDFSNDNKYNNAFGNVVNSLDGLKVDEASKKLKNLKINPDLSVDLLDAAKNADLLKGSADEIEDGIKKVGSSTDEVTGMGLAFKGLKTKIAEIAPKLAVAGVAMVGLGTAFAIYNKQQHKFTSAQEKAGESASSYQEEASKLQSLKSELDNTKARIQELQSLQKAGTITFAQETELAKLQETNAELERQVELQKDLVQTKLKISAQDAKKASETKKTFTEDMQESLGEIGGFFAGLFGNTTITDANGNPVNAKDVWKKAETNNGDSSIEGKIKKDIEDINNLKSQLEDAYDDGNLKKIESLQEKINTAKGSLYENAEIVQGWLDQSIDENGVAAKGFEEAVDGYREILNDVANIDASEAEKSLNNLETFFSSASGKTIKKYLDDIIKNGGSAEDALAAFEATGLNLSELGIDSEHFVRYFEDIENAAKKAKDTLNTVDGSIDGVKAAFESENKDADWNSMADYLEKANELYKQGKVGTDDFKSAVQFMSPKIINPDSGDFEYDADAYVEAWKNAQNKIKRYFDKDNPLQSVDNFANDLVSKGLATKVGDEFTWGFKNSAEAAKELGLSVQATEAVMHNLETYGAEFDNVMFSGEGLEKFKSSLDGVKDLYDSMSDENTGKERLGKLIENWDSEYANYQKDLSTLTEDQIVKIKFEYDLATVEQKVEDAIELAKGTNKTEDWAASQIESRNRKEMLEEQSGYDADSSGDMNYSNADKIYDSLDAKRASSNDENEIKQINKQMTAINQLQSEFQKYRIDGGELDWASYLNTDQASEVFDDLKNDLNLSKDQLLDLLDIQLQPRIELDADTTKAQEKINGIISEDHRTITMDVDASTDDINYALQSLVAGQTLKFNTEINGEPVGVEAIKDINGIIHYYIGGQEVPEDAIAGVDYNKKSQENPDDEKAGLNYYKNYQEQATNSNANVDYAKGYQEPPSNKFAQVIYKVGGAIGSAVRNATSKIKGVFGFNGTAHANGTVRTVRHGNAFVKGNWGANKTEKALVGELGQETIKF